MLLNNKTKPKIESEVQEEIMLEYANNAKRIARNLGKLVLSPSKDDKYYRRFTKIDLWCNLVALFMGCGMTQSQAEAFANQFLNRSVRP
jgi:hypothetical protein